MKVNHLSLALAATYSIWPFVSLIFFRSLNQKLSPRMGSKSLLLSVLLIPLNGAFISLLGIYSYGVWSFYMMPLCSIPPLVGMVSAAIDLRNQNNYLKSIDTLAGMLLTFSLLFSPILSLGVSNLSDTFARSKADMLISAVDQYKQQYGSYPESFSQVRNKYVQEMPVATYLKPYKWFDQYYRDYKLEFCEKNLLFLTVESIDLDSMLIYNFSQHQWTQYDAFEYTGSNCSDSQ